MASDNPEHERTPKNWLADQNFEGVTIIDPGGKVHTGTFGNVNTDDDLTITGDWSFENPLSITNGNGLRLENGNDQWRIHLDGNGDLILRDHDSGIDVARLSWQTVELLTGDLKFSGGTSGIETAGTGSDSIRVRDAANSRTFVWFHEGGPIEIPNHDINLFSSNSIQDAGTDAIQFDGNQNVTIPNGSLNLLGLPAIESSQSVGIDIDNTNSFNSRLFQVTHDNQGEQLFEVNESGNVTIPNGNLDVDDIVAASGITIDIDNDNSSSFETLNITHDGGTESLFFVREDGYAQLTHGNLSLGDNDLEGFNDLRHVSGRVEAAFRAGNSTTNWRFRDNDGTTTLVFRTGAHGDGAGLNVADGQLEVGGDSICTGVVVTGSVTLASGAATVDTGVSSGTTATFNVALGPATDDAEIAASIESQSGGNYVVHLDEINTSVGNPTVEIDVLRVR